MSLQTLILLGVQVSIFLAVLAVGLRASSGDLLSLFRTPGRLLRSLLALQVVLPIVTLAVCKAFSLHPAVIVGLVTLSIAPVSNLFSQSMLPLVANAAYARGLLFASTVLSVVLTPLTVEVIDLVFGEDVHVNPLRVVGVVVGSLLLPLGVGLALAKGWPAARRAAPVIRKIANFLLLACALPILIVAWPHLTALARTGTTTAIVLITLLGLAAGHLLGGRNEDDRTVLAHATVSRHPGVAIAVASLTDQPLAPLGVLLAVLVAGLAVAPYTRRRKHRRPAGSAPTIAPPGGARVRP